ncbi:MAG: hypothetical protein RL228_759 [Actinomycetota bacterium]
MRANALRRLGMPQNELVPFHLLRLLYRFGLLEYVQLNPIPSECIAPMKLDAIGMSE